MTLCNRQPQLINILEEDAGRDQSILSMMLFIHPDGEERNSLSLV
jgi:hypothetical protein